MNYLLEILLKLSAVTDTEEADNDDLLTLARTRHHWTLILSIWGIFTHSARARGRVPNMGGIIPAEICDQYRVKFWQYPAPAPGSCGHRSRVWNVWRGLRFWYFVTITSLIADYPGPVDKYFAGPPGPSNISLNEWHSTYPGHSHVSWQCAMTPMICATLLRPSLMIQRVTRQSCKNNLHSLFMLWQASLVTTLSLSHSLTE